MNNDHTQRIRPVACMVASNEKVVLPSVTKVLGISLASLTKTGLTFEPHRIRQQTLYRIGAEFYFASNGLLGTRQKVVLRKFCVINQFFGTADGFIYFGPGRLRGIITILALFGVMLNLCRAP